MTPDQVIAARNLLGWSRDRLGAMSDISADALSTYERYGRLTWAVNGSLGADQLAALQAILEAAGIVFIEKNGGRPGVRLQKPAGDK